MDELSYNIMAAGSSYTCKAYKEENHPPISPNGWDGIELPKKFGSYTLF
jgi:hypothetical protein